MNREKINFEPLAEWTSQGKSFQRSMGTYKGILVIWTIIIPYSPFKKASEKIWLEDITLPIETEIKNGSVQALYHEEGQGCPTFNNIEFAFDYIDELK